MERWNLEKTKELINNKYGEQQAKLAAASMESLVDRQLYASYHFHEYKKILGESLGSEQDGANLVIKAFALITEQPTIHSPLVKIPANIFACMLNLHGLLDTLSHVLCYGAGLNLGENRLTETRISGKNVQEKLNLLTKFNEVSKILLLVSGNSEVAYLDKLVNYSKHRSILKPELRIHVRNYERPEYDFIFPEFKYKNTSILARSAKNFVEGIYPILSNGVAECGNAFNEAIEKN